MDDLGTLRTKLAARTDGDGKPRPGYKGNVAAIKAAIALAEAEALDKSTEPTAE